MKIDATTLNALETSVFSLLPKLPSCCRSTEETANFLEKNLPPHYDIGYSKTTVTVRRDTFSAVIATMTEFGQPTIVQPVPVKVKKTRQVKPVHPVRYVQLSKERVQELEAISVKTEAVPAGKPYHSKYEKTGVEEPAKTAYCGKCSCQRAYSKENRCDSCGKLIWELLAQPCTSTKGGIPSHIYKLMVKWAAPVIKKSESTEYTVLAC